MDPAARAARLRSGDAHPRQPYLGRGRTKGWRLATRAVDSLPGHRRSPPPSATRCWASQFWPLLGLWAGITEIIPILGPWLGGVPAVIIALTQGWEKALLVIGFVVLLQLTENAVLVPRVMRGAVGLTPLTVFIAILAGTEFAGIPGALLAIPIAAVIQVMLSHYTEARREAKLAGLSALPGWRWMRGSVSPPAFSPLTPETSSDGGSAISPSHHRKRRMAHRDGAPMSSLAPPVATRERVWTQAAARDDVAAGPRA